MVSENFLNLDDMTHFTLKVLSPYLFNLHSCSLLPSLIQEWKRMATHPQQGEVDRAKAQLKASLLLGLDGTTAIAEDIGRSVVTTGKRSTPKEIEAAIDAVTVDDIKRCGQKYINDRGEFFFFVFSTKSLSDVGQLFFRHCRSCRRTGRGAA